MAKNPTSYSQGGGRIKRNEFKLRFKPYFKSTYGNRSLLYFLRHFLVRFSRVIKKFGEFPNIIIKDFGTSKMERLALSQTTLKNSSSHVPSIYALILRSFTRNYIIPYNSQFYVQVDQFPQNPQGKVTDSYEFLQNIVFDTTKYSIPSCKH